MDTTEDQELLFTSVHFPLYCKHFLITKTKTFICHSLNQMYQVPSFRVSIFHLAWCKFFWMYTILMSESTSFSKLLLNYQFDL